MNTSNTHRAVIEALDNTMTVIAAGPEGFCVESLILWVVKHPLGRYDHAMVLKTVLDVSA